MRERLVAIKLPMIAKLKEILLSLRCSSLVSHENLRLTERIMRRRCMLQGWNIPDRYSINGIVSEVRPGRIYDIVPYACP